MSWLTYALLAMSVKSVQNFAERSGQRKLGTWMITFLIITISTSIIAPFVLLTQPIPSTNLLFYLGGGIAASLYLIAKPLRLFALGTGDISEIVPLVSFKSIFSLILGWIVLNEIPNKMGMLGVSLIATGGYLINFERQQPANLVEKILKPIKKLFKNKTQSLLMLSLVISSVIGIFDKIAIKNTFPVSPHYVVLAENLFLIPPLFIILIIKKADFSPLKSIKTWKTPLLIGILYSIRNLLQFTSLSRGHVGYVVSINQLSSIVAVIGGVLFLNEKGIKKKLPSAILMGIGAFLVGYFS